MTRLAFIVSHPIQYYAPLYQRLAARDDIEIKVFFTWHDGASAVRDHGFGKALQWDIDLTQGYDHQLVENTARDPGTHHFAGLTNPALVDRVAAWRPDAVHVTGWAWRSHLEALYRLKRRGIPTLFRGDSHLLDGLGPAPRSWIKRAVLRRVYSWPAAFLYVGQANRAYYRYFGVPDHKLHYCPHSIDVARFVTDAALREAESAAWRRELEIGENQAVLLFAGKLEPKKCPLSLLQAVLALSDPSSVGVLVGNGALEKQVAALAAAHPARFRLLPFQNQSRMPIVYRMADLFVLPSAYGETWGLAVNEALACGRPVLVSDRVGCAADLVTDEVGAIFDSKDPVGLHAGLEALLADRGKLAGMQNNAARAATAFDIGRTADALCAALDSVLQP